MASGADVLNVALREAAAGVKEYPPGTNNVKYWAPWGSNLGAWCYAFVTWCCEQAGAPLPRAQPHGIAGVQVGVAYSMNRPAEVVCAFDTNGNVVMGDPRACQPGDIVHFSWLRISWENGWPWVLEGGRWVTAGDHVGLFHSWASGGVMNTVEGNTSVNGSQDNGGAVLVRQRPTGVVINVWRPAVYQAGLSMPTGPLVPAIQTGGQPQSSYLEGMPMPALVRADEAGTIVAIDGVFYRRKKSMDVVNAELAAGVYAHADLNTPRPGILAESIDIEAILWAINQGANNTDRTIQLVSAMAADNQRMAAESQRTSAAIVNAVQSLQQAVAGIQVGGGGHPEPVVVPSAEENATALLAALLKAASGQAAA